MEILLIVILSILVFVLWRSSKKAAEQLRDEIQSLQRDVGFLQDKLAALLNPQTASSASSSVPVPTAPPAAAPDVPPLTAPSPQTPPQPTARVAAPSNSVTAFQQPAPASAMSPPVPVQTPPQPAPMQPARPPLQAPARSAPQVATPRATEPEAKQEETRRLFSLEEKLGANWLNKLGIAILVVGLAFFLAYKLQTWGPAGKILCGYCVSFALLAGGVWLERKATYRIFARGGIGGGWALTFFTTYAMYHVTAAKVLQSLVLDLILMLIVAAGMVLHSLRYKSQTVTGLAFLLGFVTLLTSHLEAAGGTVAFSLAASAILAVALVVVTTMRHWAWLELAGLITVYLSHLVWLMRVLPDDHKAFAEFWPSTVLILLYWLIFRLAYVLRTPLDQKEESISSLSAVLNSIGVLGLLKFQSAHPEWAFWALIALGAVEMGLAFRLRSRRRQAFVVLSTIATVLLISAVPFKFHGVSWPVLWLIQAQVLAISGLRLGEPVFRRLGLLAGLVTGGVLAFHDLVPLLILRLGSPDLNRHASLTVALALAAALYWIHAEVYPRRWPQIAENDLEAFALRITSWLGAAAAATALWVALPDLWLPVGWLALVLLLGFTAHRFGAIRLALEADILAFGSAVVLFVHHIGPLAIFRLDYPDPGHHPAETAVLALAAVAYWVRSEVYPRALRPLIAIPASSFDLNGWQAFAPPAASFLGAAACAASLWVALPAPWVVVGWLALVVLLGLVADWIKAQTLAMQADALALASVCGLYFWDLWTQGWSNHNAPLIAAVFLLYLGMRRKTTMTGSHDFVAPAYSWAATLLLAFAAAEISSVVALTEVWAILGLALFEVGRLTRKGFLRWQGYFLVALAFGRYLLSLFGLFEAAPHPSARGAEFSLVNSLLLEMLTLALVGYLLLERTRNRDRCKQADSAAGLVADALGTLSIALWFAFRFPSEWVPAPAGEAWVTPIWAGMATALLALAWFMRRRTFLFQGIALAIAAVTRGLVLDLPADSPPDFWHGPLFYLGITSLTLLAALPFAFQLRGDGPFESKTDSLPQGLGAILRHPEQLFFFSAFALEVMALAFKLTSGHITIAWSLLGLVVFLFALAVGERSFRLAGLGLLLVSVAKILLIDVWKLSPSDRYTTLIVLGLALLAVSFLYTRFGTAIRKLL